MNASLDIHALLAPVAGDNPCGEDMEYTADFAELLAAASGRPEQQVGEAIVPAVDPDWSLVARLATGLLARTHDLRVATLLARAWLHAEGLAGLRAGLTLIRAYVEDQWDTLYPRLDAEDGFDPAIRINALSVLCHLGAVVHPLRERPLLHSATGRPISLDAVAAARGSEAPDSPAGVAAPTLEEITNALDGADRQRLESIADDARRALDAAAAIERELGRRAGAAQAPDFEPLTRALADIAGTVGVALARRPEAAAAPASPSEIAPEACTGAGTAGEHCLAETGAPLSAPHEPGLAAPSRGALQSRDDVLRGLDEMCRYFRQHEPSHPVPILLTRARRWIEMDFMDLLRDLAPEAVGEAEKLRGASHAD